MTRLERSLDDAIVPSSGGASDIPVGRASAVRSADG
jgi:hypothetical protein